MNIQQFKVRFCRKFRFICCLVLPEIYIDGKQLDYLRNGKTLETYLSEGEHEILISAQLATIIKKINVRQDIRINVILHINSFEIEILDDKTGEKIIINEANDNINNHSEQRISAKNNFSNKSYWKYVISVALFVALTQILILIIKLL